MDQLASYDGSSRFLHWWPATLLAIAAWILWIDWVSALQWATFLTAAAFAQAHFIPWRFGVFDDGLVLLFPFGRRVFLPKSTTTVRLETVGAVALSHGHRHLGYLLHDGVLYVPDQRSRLRRALDFYGYRVV
jgi:hypothetical protein